MKIKKCLSGVLAFAMVFNTGFANMQVAAAGGQQPAATQTESQPEVVYVNSYDASQRCVSFNENWRFHLGEVNGAEAASYNDSSWNNVTLPHDYSIDQGFTTSAPAEQESGYVLGGTGWYRKAFTLSGDMRDKVISVDFDGVYMNATVYINGVKLGTHPYGYTSFSFVLPNEHLKFGGEENVISVKVEHKQPSSRWYSGSGIYRDVNLSVTDPVHIARYGTQVTTPDIDKGTGTVDVVATVENDTAEEISVSVQQAVFEKGGKEPVVTGTKTEEKTVAPGASVDIEDTLTVENPKLWDTENPNLYLVRTEVFENDVLVDSYDSEFGFRWVTFTKDNGFFLNGENVKLKGVCMHHDQGALGSEAWYSAIERQVETMKEMGVNAIRVTHNPSSQALIDICNEKGMMLIDEAFDCWIHSKNGNSNDYAKWFASALEEDNQIVGGEDCEQWAEFDVKEMVKRALNSPSIIMWSLGNEVFEGIGGADTSTYPQIAADLMTWIAEEDTTHYVTFGDNKVKSGNSTAISTAQVIAQAESYGLPGGIIGYNYGSSGNINTGYSNYGWMVYGSETASSVNSRGVYDRKNSNSDGGIGDRRLTSYDKSCVGWGHQASNAMWITMQQAFNAGEFVWTGFDYLGEPTPYNWTGTGSNGTWPNVSKSSYFGIVDSAGIPKDSFYLYQSQWNENVNTLHVLPVWNEEEIMLDKEGKTEVVVYSDAPVIKLYLNGKEVGTATAKVTDTPTGGYQNYTTGTGCFDSGKASGHTSLYATFNVPYEEGKLEAKAFQKDGVTQITQTEGRSYVETVSSPSKLQAKANHTEITADGRELCYVTIEVTDTDGKFVNSAEPEITVSVEGDGKLMALDNGVQNDVTTYTESTRKAGKGKLMAIVQSTEDAGSFTVSAAANGYASAAATVTTKAEDKEVTGKVVDGYEISKNIYVKKGETPVLPSEVKVIYSDDTTETKAVTWDALPEGQDSFTVYGTIADVNLRISVNVTMIDKVAAILNYSAAIGKDAALSLPETRPAVIADGSVLTAEFPVVWDVPEDLTATLGTKIITGTATVFDETMPVSASIRVTSGSYKDGTNAIYQVPEIYIGGVSSKMDSDVASVLTKLRDGNTSKTDGAWNGKDTLDFRLDTAVVLKNFTLYIQDTAPTSDTIKVYSSGNNGESWTEAECKVSNRREDGVTVRTYAPVQTISETWYRIECTKTTTLTEVEMNTSVPTFGVGSEAALASLEAGGRIANQESLDKGYLGIQNTDLTTADIKAVGKDNTSLTILEKDSENVIRILMESEDHSTRAIYQVLLGVENVVTGAASDASRDYPVGNMTLTAPSVESGGSVNNAKDNNLNTIWHSNWGGGVGPADLQNEPENRYIEMQLAEVTEIDAVRYYPRNDGNNGKVSAYRIDVSVDGTSWKTVAEGDGWSTATEWKIAAFSAVEAKNIRLYGTTTAGDTANKYMSAAEVRVRCAAQELYSGNTTVTLKEEDKVVDYTGSEITPKPVVVYTPGEGAEPVTLVENQDYTLEYIDNLEPGTAQIIVNGAGNYVGILKTSFTINPVDMEIISYDPVSVTTAKNEKPMLPGTVVAKTNVGDQILEVKWDQISSSALNIYGTLNVYGTVVETGDRVRATVEISDVIGIVQVTAATVIGSDPVLPSQVTVYYSNGNVEKKDVTWNLKDADFGAEGIVKVTGTVGKYTAEAKVRVDGATQDANNTPVGTNLSLNENGVNATTSWPRTFSYVAGTDYAHFTTDGNVEFRSDSSKKIWSDWERGQYHTNTEAAVGAKDHVPFVVTAFGEKGTTDNAKQKKYTVNKVSVGFLEEDGASASKVRLPRDYKIEYYSDNGGVIDASRINNTTASGCSNVRDWGADNPVKAHDGWTEVEYVGGKPAVPALADSKQMIDIPIEAVETTAIRITVIPQDSNWVGIEEIETYYVPITAKEDYVVTSIKVDGTDVLAQFDEDTKSLDVDAEAGEITAEATNNASVTVLEAVNGAAKIIFLPENADEAKKQEYTVNFKKAATEESSLIAASDEHVDLLTAKAKEGATVTFQAQKGYTFAKTPVILKSADSSATGIEVTEENGVYSFIMPAYGVTVSGDTKAIAYAITYLLGGGTVSGNPATYTIEDRAFTLKNPVKEGYTFLGWTSDTVSDPQIRMTVLTGTTGNLVFAANWRLGTTYTITFDSMGGSEVEAQKVPIDSAFITEPESPVRRGYTFAGWYSDEELTKLWSFAEDTAITDMTLYAKWTESPVKVNTEMPVYYLEQPFNMPGNINVTVNEETFNTNVSWNQEDLAALLAAEEVGAYEVRGVLAELEDREITVKVTASPDGIVYFVDNGAASFTAKAELMMAANKGIVKNAASDQAYDGIWGFTNDPDDLEVSESGDAYTTIRNFKAGRNNITMTYRFALEAGTYHVAVGFRDPWSQWAGDLRHAEVTLTDAMKEQLAIHEDYHISGTPGMVQFDNVTVAADGSVDLNMRPLKTGDDSCDVLVSFIVIRKAAEAQKQEYTVSFDTGKGSEVAPMTVLEDSRLVKPEEPVREGYDFTGWYKDANATTPWNFETDKVTDNTTLYAGWMKRDVTGADEKAGLKAAIDIAAGLRAADYTEASYKKLSEALTAARDLYEADDVSKDQINQKIDDLAKAIKGLESVYKEQNNTLQETIKNLESQLSEKNASLTQKEKELDEAKETANRLQGDLDTANGKVTSLTGELETAKRELEELKENQGDKDDQIASLKATITQLEKDLTAAQNKAADLQTEVDNANAKVKLLEAERDNLQTSVTDLENKLVKAEEDKKAAEKKEAELAEELKKAQEDAKAAKEEADKAKKELEKLQDSLKLKKGDMVESNGVKYRVTDADKKIVEAYRPVDKKAVSITIASTVKVKDQTCTVASIADNAFTKMKKLNKVIVGKNVTKIGKKAFYADKKLKTIQMKGNKLKAVGKSALKGISSKAVIKVPKAKKKAYTKIFKGKGQKKSVKVK